MKGRHGSDRYAMGVDLATTYNHPGYSEKLSAMENAEKGYRKNRSWLQTSRQLQLLANINKNRNPEAHEKFKTAAEYAKERLHRKERLAYA